MGGGGGFQDLDINKVNEATAKVQPPAWARETVPGITDFSLDEAKSNELSNHYRSQTMKAAQALQPQDPGEQTRNISDAVGRSNADGRLPDPDYDLISKGGVDYRKLEWTPTSVSALASQRAQDYLNDEIARAAEQRREFGKAEQQRMLEMRQAYEEKRLFEAAQGDQEARNKSREARLNDLLRGNLKGNFGAGRSLLALDEFEKTDQGKTLLAGK